MPGYTNYAQEMLLWASLSECMALARRQIKRHELQSREVRLLTRTVSETSTESTFLFDVVASNLAVPMLPHLALALPE